MIYLWMFISALFLKLQSFEVRIRPSHISKVQSIQDVLSKVKQSEKMYALRFPAEVWELTLPKENLLIIHWSKYIGLYLFNKIIRGNVLYAACFLLSWFWNNTNESIEIHSYKIGKKTTRFLIIARVIITQIKCCVHRHAMCSNFPRKKFGARNEMIFQGEGNHVLGDGFLKGPAI